MVDSNRVQSDLHLQPTETNVECLHRTWCRARVRVQPGRCGSKVDDGGMREGTKPGQGRRMEGAERGTPVTDAGTPFEACVANSPSQGIGCGTRRGTRSFQHHHRHLSRVKGESNGSRIDSRGCVDRFWSPGLVSWTISRLGSVPPNPSRKTPP